MLVLAIHDVFGDVFLFLILLGNCVLGYRCEERDFRIYRLHG